VVLASVHSRFNMEEEEMTRRVIKAIKNPNVKILAHPTGRLILKREPFKINLQAVIRAAIDQGVVMQLELMKFGVFTARRGWIEAKDVINTLPLERLLKMLRR
jgi:DNA polymerase (family 10)